MRWKQFGVKRYIYKYYDYIRVHVFMHFGRVWIFNFVLGLFGFDAVITILWKFRLNVILNDYLFSLCCNSISPCKKNPVLVFNSQTNLSVVFDLLCNVYKKDLVFVGIFFVIYLLQFTIIVKSSVKKWIWFSWISHFVTLTLFSLEKLKDFGDLLLGEVQTIVFQWTPDWKK